MTHHWKKWPFWRFLTYSGPCTWNYRLDTDMVRTGLGFCVECYHSWPDLTILPYVELAEEVESFEILAVFDLPRALD